MRLFAIGDTHLPSTRGKTMDRFGWTGHPGPLAEAWDRSVTAEDAIIVAGDISWATKPAEVADDLAWLDARPGKRSSSAATTTTGGATPRRSSDGCSSPTAPWSASSTTLR